MKRITAIAILASLILMAATGAFAEAAKTINLPAPVTTGGMPLMDALKARCTTRAYETTPLPPQELSNLLWAAFGFNRADKRTAPTAMNRQEIDIYVVLPEGAYLWDAKANVLNLVAEGDLRGATGPQDFVKTAPLNLVLVADYAKMGERGASMHDVYAAADASFISENVYLYCASAGLGTVVRGYVDKEACAKALGLPAEKKVVWGQTVGYPKK